MKEHSAQIATFMLSSDVSAIGSVGRKERIPGSFLMGCLFG